MDVRRTELNRNLQTQQIVFYFRVIKKSIVEVIDRICYESSACGAVDGHVVQCVAFSQLPCARQENRYVESRSVLQGADSTLSF